MKKIKIKITGLKKRNLLFLAALLRSGSGKHNDRKREQKGKHND